MLLDLPSNVRIYDEDIRKNILFHCNIFLAWLSGNLIFIK